MGKYAPNKDCAMCTAIGELCMGCAIEWKQKHWARELGILRAFARAFQRGEGQARLGIRYDRWRAHLKKKPRTNAARNK